MSPIKPHWAQPSHPHVQEVIVNEAAFTTKSISKTTLPPFGLFAKMDFPPCTVAPEATYATVQTGRDSHLDLNSDLLYINHSCEPSLIFDTASFTITAGPKGLKPGDELTFFYPSTEWYMAQPFTCLCGTPTCRGRIAGARDMTPTQLEGLWLNRHIRDLLEERDGAAAAAAGGAAAGGAGQVNGQVNGHGHGLKGGSIKVGGGVSGTTAGAGAAVGGSGYVTANSASADVSAGAQRRGPTSRELSGEMGGDTSV
ncbi:uncharacterized protein C8A04DRAFT_29341 [Dichotomopilus funicola]|uniref:Post-SET domain-containing protein n=1 Tax=Dichotomopilus funicola TaxID=1934379 RepID=A0AAN6V1Z1_9PEZI|nr:hypothetical protein C8A04DRAFT_29341 [Dichotomopilus funicola]